MSSLPSSKLKSNQIRASSTQDPRTTLRPCPSATMSQRRGPWAGGMDGYRIFGWEERNHCGEPSGPRGKLEISLLITGCGKSAPSCVPSACQRDASRTRADRNNSGEIIKNSRQQQRLNLSVFVRFPGKTGISCGMNPICQLK